MNDEACLRKVYSAVHTSCGSYIEEWKHMYIAVGYKEVRLTSENNMKTCLLKLTSSLWHPGRSERRLSPGIHKPVPTR